MMYNYKAIVNRVVDGDTINLTIDLGFRLSYTANCRMAGINAPEMSENAGKTSKAALMEHLQAGEVVDIISTGLDKYGRPLVIVKANGTDINIKMITQGFAVKM
jgi:endonuclease YncB( thermonuclease family)